MKKSLQLIAAAFVMSLFFSSCVSVKEIGDLNMVSTRNVESDAHYTLISTYIGGDKTEIRKSRSKTIDDAINQTVKSIPGGEYLKNVKIYEVYHGKNNSYYAVEGDVWGLSNGAAVSYRGFKVGDKVTWKAGPLGDKKFVTGIITSLKSDKTCLVKRDDNQVIVELSYDDISKSK